MTHKKILTIAGFVAAVIAVPQPSRAQSVGADLTYFTREGLDVVSPVFDVTVPVGTLSVGAQWGIAIGSASGDSKLALLNPALFALYSQELGIAKLRVGAGVAIPLLRVDDADDYAKALVATGGGATRGLWNSWLYAAEALTIMAPARLEFNIPGVGLVAEGALFLMIDAGDAREEQEFGFQLAGEATLPIIPVFDVGLRLQLVSPLTSDDDKAQLSAEPFVGLNVGPVGARLGFVMNLDEPLGFAFDSGKVWGIHASASISI